MRSADFRVVRGRRRRRARILSSRRRKQQSDRAERITILIVYRSAILNITREKIDRDNNHAAGPILGRAREKFAAGRGVSARRQ